MNDYANSGFFQAAVNAIVQLCVRLTQPRSQEYNSPHHLLLDRFLLGFALTVLFLETRKKLTI